jgi:hypothetical protein
MIPLFPYLADNQLGHTANMRLHSPAVAIIACSIDPTCMANACLHGGCGARGLTHAELGGAERPQPSRLQTATYKLRILGEQLDKADKAGLLCREGATNITLYVFTFHR